MLLATRKYEHGLGSAPLSRYYDPDTSAPKTWRWYSCVCHRLIPPRSRLEWRSLAAGTATHRYPHHDNCLAGEPMFCPIWPPEYVVGAPGKCTVGALGCLLACRQAYAEGIDLLYSTNTFFIESAALFDAWFCPVPRSRHLLLPQRLASITSLELRWRVLLFGRDNQEHRSDQDRAHLASHLRHLCAAFPNLRTLVLSFSDLLYNDRRVRPAQALDEIDRVLLRPLAEAVARLPLRAQQQSVVVELPSKMSLAT
ncbi:hypothetical protein MFIFM68171_08278 [Madurella fahalii]|uniref:DUF7730 domain-containing protein n=1 Tax=Madurella fahalii TaxID=1157608 RepID=A0ABQ0GJX7_9PEZI